MVQVKLVNNIEKVNPYFTLFRKKTPLDQNVRSEILNALDEHMVECFDDIMIGKAKAQTIQEMMNASHCIPLHQPPNPNNANQQKERKEIFPKKEKHPKQS